MAPSLEEPSTEAFNPVSGKDVVPKGQQNASIADYTPGRTVVKRHDNYRYEHLRPSYPDKQYPELQEVLYTDKGIIGDPQLSNLKVIATEIFDYNPKIGTEVHGVDLSKLTDDQKNDIARLIALRGVVFFRDQKNFDIEAQRSLGAYFGTLHKHATTCVPKTGGLDDVHVILYDENSKDQRTLFTPTFQWHSDVTYEIQPPSYTSLKVLTGPPRGGGGDTLWSSQYAAYDYLSAPMQRYLSTLTALHSAEMQAAGSIAAGRTVRREPIITEHPLVRTHPVTGWKSLFFNPGFVTSIVGVPKMESDAIVHFLNELIATTVDIQVRFMWRENDVAFWDNRICNHTATWGFSPHRRHAVRVACHGERPVFDPAGKSQEQDLAERYGLPVTDKDGSRTSNYND